MGRMMRKTQRRVENLIAWVLALLFVVLVLAGGWYIAIQAGVV